MLLAVLVALLALYLISRASERTPFGPASIFSLVWLLAVVLPLLMAPDFRYDWWGIWYICGAVGAFCLGSLVVGASEGSILRPQILASSIRFRGPRAFAARLELLSRLSVLSGVAAGALTVWSNGLSVSQLTS